MRVRANRTIVTSQVELGGNKDVNTLTEYVYRRIHADVIVYIFAHLHTALRIEGNML